ncbi:MAG: dTDP-glucose 4,6-dehydratase [bacterium]
MKILVTGGAGFIGSNFIRYFLQKHSRYQVINLDKLTYAGNLNNLIDVARNTRYRFVKGNITNSKLVSSIMKKADAVIHFAAETHVDRSIQDSDAFIQTNLVGTNVLLACALKTRIQKFVHISTDEVYGSIRKGYADESYPLLPSSPYSSSKAGSDLLALSYAKTYGLPVVITRSSNNFGPYQYPEKVLPVFITNALMNLPIPIYADGSNVRDWLYVEDNCRAIDLAFHIGSAGEIYNVGGMQHMKNIDLAERVLDIMGKSRKLISFVTDRPGHDYRYALNISKISRKLKFKPSRNFDSDLEHTIRWYINNVPWWKKLRARELSTA